MSTSVLTSGDRRVAEHSGPAHDMVRNQLRGNGDSIGDLVGTLVDISPFVLG